MKTITLLVLVILGGCAVDVEVPAEPDCSADIDGALPTCAGELQECEGRDWEVWGPTCPPDAWEAGARPVCRRGYGAVCVGVGGNVLDVPVTCTRRPTPCEMP